MRYLVLITFSALCLLFACTKDSVQTTVEKSNLPAGARDNQNVIICHLDDDGLYHAISVSVNALPAHLAHGDYLPDADGDGYTAVGACTGSMDDCDDNNPNVHPGAEEICDNGIDDNCDGNIDEGCCTGCCFPNFTEGTFEGANFLWYYDADVNNCDYLFPSNAIWLECDNFIAAVIGDYGGEQVVIFSSYQEECLLVVGVDITQAQYDAAKALLRTVITANSIPNYCDLYGLSSASSTQLKRFKTILENAKSGKLPTVSGQ